MPALDLAGGAWRLQRDSLVTASGAALSKPGFHDQDWLVATVPGTVLTSYLNAGAMPDPNFGDNQLAISDSFFYADFWYRNEFVAPPVPPGRHVWLNFDGINWKADVFLNGEKLGRIEGGFMRGRFDVTGHLRAGAEERAGRARREERHAGQRQGEDLREPGQERRRAGRRQPHLSCLHRLGLDSHDPRTQHRHLGQRLPHHHRPGDDRESLRHYELPLPDARADVTIEATLRNHESQPVTGTLRGRFGDVAFESAVTLDASAGRRRSKLTSCIVRRIPSSGGRTATATPNLYPVELKFETADEARVRHEVVPGRRAPVHLQRRWRRAEDLDQRAALHRRAAATGASASRCCAIARANTTPPCAITAT